MPVWGWIVIAAIIVVAIVAVVVGSSTSRRKNSERLQERFGPEYDRTVAETGDEKAAEKELLAREKKHKKLDIRPLTPEALRHYTGRWQAVQTAFVDDPSSALGDAERLVAEVMNERGYPVDDFEQQAADISVDHPSVVENYRAAHGIHQSGNVGTEEQRQAFVHYRALFAKLLETETVQDKSQEATA